jgi:hypothetical protein
MGDGDPGGTMDMDTDAVAEAGRRLQTTGDTLTTRWAAAAAEITAAEPGIGHGRLADAFTPTYQKISNDVHHNADQIPPWFTELASATSIAAVSYGTTDAGIADRFRALTGSNVPGVPIDPLAQTMRPPLGGG